ncbi:uncharacterized protein LOC109835548 [Asparagus officinalis]|uniref:uncharacterized protein LOC109835548 n=1 Tax=Asparagus officinalis TaxID=4686 RepID=UPI00098E1533|nr:uncharacterized protein LOC109835548 [Asparagus officinalis]
MNLSFWNVRGLNRPSKQKIVKHHLWQYHVSFIALLETKIRDSLLSSTTRFIAKDWSWLSNVRSPGKARIVILWNPNILNIQLISSSDQCITCTVKSLDGKLDCVISSIYGFNQMETRKELWSELKSIHQTVGNTPWLLFGDFNAIISNEEKIGGSILHDSETEDFRNFINDCQLDHLKNIGCFYTWNNKQDHGSRIWSRLDRVLMNDKWIQNYNSSQVEFLLPKISDHSPGLITVSEDSYQGKRPFKFFKMWTKHACFLPTVANIWQQRIKGCTMFSVCSKLKTLKIALKDINKKFFYNISEQVYHAKQALEDVQKNLQTDPMSPEFIKQEKVCISKYNTLMDCELSFYKQKARTDWSIQGDRCTELFHSMIKANRHQNRVMILYNNLGQRLTEGDDIVKEFISHFKNLMGTAMDTTSPNINIIHPGPCLDDSQASSLIASITNEEIRNAIFSMPDNKAPGPDGYNATFFKSSWSIVGDEVTQAIADFFRTGKLLDMLLGLQFPNKMVDWIMTCITIKDMLLGLQFPNKMVDWIMTCITSPSYSISLNGSLHGYFKGKRGLRQGDPLSPYLFILGMEYLSRSLDLLKNDRQFNFHPMCRKLKISHLVFADDLLLFSKGDLNSVLKLNQCLKEFSSVTGLEPNSDKCHVFFGGVHEATKVSIKELLGIAEGSLPIRYLGMPLVCKRLSYSDCNPLLNKISNQIQLWSKSKNLSYAGKLQVIKSVILGVQIYWTSCYILLVCVLQKIDDICRDFLWGRTEHSQKPSLIAWGKICCDKKSGGLGIFSARLWNLAAALKNIWYIHLNKELLWIKWIHGKYLKNGDIWLVNAKSGDSWLWKQLIKSRDRAAVLVGGIDILKQVIGSCYKNSKVKTSALYEALSPTVPQVPWFNTVWEKMKYPKHSFICWLAVQNRLLTQDRLLMMGIIQSNSCCLCLGAGPEDRDHLFFDCVYSQNVWNRVMCWLKFKWRSCSWSYLLDWFNNCLRGRGFKKGIKRMAFSVTLYKIWCERNTRIFSQTSKGFE